MGAKLATPTPALASPGRPAPGLRGLQQTRAGGWPQAPRPRSVGRTWRVDLAAGQMDSSPERERGGGQQCGAGVPPRGGGMETQTGVGGRETPRAGENLSAFPLVLNLKPQKCAVWLGRVKSRPDSTGDPSSSSWVHGSLPHSASLSLPVPASQSKTGILSLHFLLGTSFWALPNRSMPRCELKRAWRFFSLAPENVPSAVGSWILGFKILASLQGCWEGNGGTRWDGRTPGLLDFTHSVSLFLNPCKTGQPEPKELVMEEANPCVYLREFWRATWELWERSQVLDQKLVFWDLNVDWYTEAAFLHPLKGGCFGTENVFWMAGRLCALRENGGRLQPVQAPWKRLLTWGRKMWLPVLLCIVYDLPQLLPRYARRDAVKWNSLSLITSQGSLVHTWPVFPETNGVSWKKLFLTDMAATLWLWVFCFFSS